MIRILTDSASDILPAEAAQLGVTVIPLNVTLEDGTVFRDGLDKTPSEYYAQLAACKKLPTTSQPSPELFERFFAEAAAAGDEVIGIFLSHELSGTCQCAKLAADLANVDNVLFVDSTNVCLGEGLLVRLAVQLRDAGKTAVQIAASLEHAKEHLHLVAAIDDLKYLRKGGRLPAVLPARLYYKVMQYEQYIIYGVFIILMLGWLDGPLSFLRGVVYNFLNLITGFLG